MTVTIVCRNNTPPPDDAARADESARAEGADKEKGTPAKSATPAKETPPRVTSASDGVCRLGQGTDLNVIGALHPGTERGNGLVEPSANSRTGVGLRTGEPEPPAASPTGELRPETARAVEEAARVPGTSDVMVANDQRGAIQGWGELIRTTPGLEDAARARGMSPENLAQILGSTAWNQRIEGAAGESAVGIPTDPKQVWDLAQRAMDTQIPSLARQATTAGQVVSDNAIARMTADGTPLPEAVRTFGTEIRDTANDLHRFYADTDQADRFPAFTAASGGELTQQMLNASFRSADGYDSSMGNFEYDPDRDYAQTEYGSDSSEPALEPGFVGNTQIAETRAESDRRTEQLAVLASQGDDRQEADEVKRDETNRYVGRRQVAVNTEVRERGRIATLPPELRTTRRGPYVGVG